MKKSSRLNTDRIIEVKEKIFTWKPINQSGRLGEHCWNASLRLWAGSVEIIKTGERTLEKRMELQVVLPTLPLPPIKTHLRDSCSSMFCTVPCGISVAISHFFCKIWLWQKTQCYTLERFLLQYFLELSSAMRIENFEYWWLVKLIFHYCVMFNRVFLYCV